MTTHDQVLSLIRQHQEISQAEIRTLTGLSASAVSSAVKRAQQLGVVHESGITQEALGRPRKLLKLNPDYGYTIGVQVNSNYNQIVLCDLHGNIIQRDTLSHPTLDPHVIAADIQQFAIRVTHRPILGIGLAVSGIIDHERGICLDSTTAGWHDVPIGPIVQQATGIPTHVENDANSLGIAEMLFGEARHASSFVIMTIGKGIGAGIVIQRNLYRGRNGVAGEIGHIRITSPSKVQCHCGKTGCLEATSGALAIAREFQERLGTPVSINELPTLIAEHKDLAAEILGGVGERLGIALAQLATTFDPDAVFVAPEPHLGLSSLEPIVQDSFKAELLPVTRTPTTLRFLTESTDMWARGAASVAIDQFFTSLSQEFITA
ncbi:ROK family transcriptional regulator [Deinococcus roseus]|uniref:Sugar kinase n=1 Tax=Deinococcus roseus TaxID=392414 RepID=A0ABQ2D2A8_9DEIO|nr:ROK family transcriptional regulator [Deinococcus roseus]GGJ43022.1 sugar kinase [Deinococcus roseus]